MLSKQYILIVDDEKSIREGIAENLSESFYQTKLAADGYESYEQLKEGNIILIVSDIKMAKMDGLDFLKSIKEKWPNIPVIMMTGFTSYYSRSELLESGASDFIEKPFFIDSLMNMIANILKNLILQQKNGQ